MIEQSFSTQTGTSRQAPPRLRAWAKLGGLLLLTLGLSLLWGCGATPEPTPAAVAPAASATSAPPPSPPPSALPTVPFSQPTATAGSPETRQTGSPTSTTAAPTLRWTSTPSPSPTPVLTPTATPPPTLTPTPLFSPTPLPTAAGSADWLNLLLIGLDSTTNLHAQNTDVIIVVGVNRHTRQVSILSIPRDLWVYIPTHGWSRINVAHKTGYTNGFRGEGPGLLARTIEVNLGIPIDNWARVDFQGFRRVVDQLGGVDIAVACPVDLEYQPGESGGSQVLQPGIVHMDGETALRYVRTRRGSSDFDRAHRQQQFLKAMWDQRKNIGLTEIPGLFSALTRSIETNLGLGDILSLAPVALDLRPERIRSRSIGPDQTQDWTTADGWRVLLPRSDKIQALVAGLYGPPFSGDDQVAAESARVQVRNGTERAQLAKIAADQLRWAGLNVVDTGLADRPDYAETQIVVFSDKPLAVARLTGLLKIKPQNVIQRPDPNQPADLQVILGADYDPCR